MLKAGSLVMLLTSCVLHRQISLQAVGGKQENIRHKDTGYKEHSIQQKQT